MDANSFDDVEDTVEDVLSSERACFVSEFPTAIASPAQTDALREAIRRFDLGEASATTTLVGQTAVIAELRRESGFDEPEVRSAVFTLTRRSPEPEVLPKPSNESARWPEETVRIRAVRPMGTLERLWLHKFELASGALLATSVAVAIWILIGS